MNLGLLVLLSTLILGSVALYVSQRPAKLVQSTEEFLLADRRLSASSVTNLLLSSSFGVNAVFYNGWLGYQLGLWALLVQLTWAASFFLLARHASAFEGIQSLHDLLGRRFGRTTQVLGATCSIAGITYFIGWELSLGRSAVVAIVERFGSSYTIPPSVFGNVVAGIVLFFTIAYTVRGGIGGNGTVNKLLNGIKIGVVAVLVAMGLLSIVRAGASGRLAPPLTEAFSSLGLWGILTNVLFNVSWQFVDNSSWQCAIAGAKGEGSVSRNLKAGGLSVFFTIGLMGTLLGAVLRPNRDLPDTEFFAGVIQLAGTAAPVFSLLLAVVVVAAMMSLVDGMLLAVALAVVADLIPPGRMRLEQGIAIARAVVVIVGVAAGVGVDALARAIGGGLFDFVYIVVVSQLALLGPVLVALGGGHKADGAPMWAAILLALCVGFGAVLFGTALGVRWLVDGAGTMTLAVSTATAIGLASLERK